MPIGLDDLIYCSPYSSVVSLDQLLDCPSGDDRAFDVADSRPGSDTLVDRQRVYELIHGAVNDLPPRQRTVIRAIYFGDCTVTQTARLLMVSAAAVVKLRKKALKRLRNILPPNQHILFAGF